jgi:hypothetical protein
MRAPPLPKEGGITPPYSVTGCTLV